VLAATLLLLVESRSLWAHLPRMLDLLIELGVPAASAWAVRHLRMEGRAPLRALCGLVTYLATPRLGRLRGRPYREQPACPVTSRLFVAAIPPAVPGGPRARAGAGR
jgi:hypothetical protein